MKKFLLISYHDSLPLNERKLLEGADIHTFTPFPGAVAYLVSRLHEYHIEADYLVIGNDYHETIDKITGKYEFVGISTTFTASIDLIRSICLSIKNKMECKVIIGGPYIAAKIKESSHAARNHILGFCKADIYINSFHGEDTLVDILKEARWDYASIGNIFYKMKESQYNFTFEEADETDLEQTIYWNLFENSCGEYVNVRTCISCPYSCAYCAFPAYAGTYMERSLESLFHELDLIESMKRVKVVHFIDDTFNVNRKRFREILGRIVQKKYTFKWHGYIRAQLLDEEIVRFMAESGCLGVLLGVESGSQRMLDEMNKKAQIEDIVQKHRLLQKYNITTIASFFVGFPTETKESVEDTLRVIDEMKPDFYEIRPWFYNRNTPVYERREQYGLAGSGACYSHKTMSSQEAGKWCDWIIQNVKGSVLKNMTDYTLFMLLAGGTDLDTIKRMVEAFNEKRS